MQRGDLYSLLRDLYSLLNIMLPRGDIYLLLNIVAKRRYIFIVEHFIVKGGSLFIVEHYVAKKGSLFIVEHYVAKKGSLFIVEHYHDYVAGGTVCCMCIHWLQCQFVVQVDNHDNTTSAIFKVKSVVSITMTGYGNTNIILYHLKGPL